MTCTRATLLQRLMARLVVAAASVALAGCGQVSGSSRSTVALRIIDASPDAGALDIYANGTALAYNVGFGTVSSYVSYAPGSYTLTGRQSGTAVKLTSTPAALALRAQYTLLVGNVAAGLQTLLLQDQGQPAPAGQVALRFIDQATRIGPVDLYLVPQGSSLVATSPVVSNVTFTTAANVPTYLTVPAGAYTLVVLPAGVTPTATTVARYSGAVVTYAPGSARTVILLDRPPGPTPALQVVTTSDCDPASATT